MNFNKLLRSLFGDKSSRDMKLIQPLVEKVKAVYPEVQKLDNDQLRQRTKEIQRQVQNSAQKQKEEIDKLKATIEDTPIDERADIFAKIDKLDKEVLDIYEDALNEVMPEVFAIVKETARRFAENEETVVTATDFDRELAADPRKDFITIDGDKAIYHNHWTAGGNDLKWEMVHYDVQLFGGVVLHQVGWRGSHVVAQVVETELVVGTKGDVSLISTATRLAVGLVLVDAVDAESMEHVERSHPLGVTLGQIVVDGDDVDAVACQGVQEDG